MYNLFARHVLRQPLSLSRVRHGGAAGAWSTCPHPWSATGPRWGAGLAWLSVFCAHAGLFPSQEWATSRCMSFRTERLFDHRADRRREDANRNGLVEELLFSVPRPWLLPGLFFFLLLWFVAVLLFGHEPWDDDGFRAEVPERANLSRLLSKGSPERLAM